MRPSWSSLLGGCLGGGGGGGGGGTMGKVRPPGSTVGSDDDHLRVFTFAELSAATRGFDSDDNFIGKGMHGVVYKGFAVDDSGGAKPAQAVAVRRIDRRHAAARRHEEGPLEEAILLGKLRHPNLVKTMGYIREEAEQLAVYEYMAHGSLDYHLFRRRASYFTTDLQDIPEVLPWLTRLNIAIGVAKGLSFLHDAGEKTFVHGDLKASNILLDQDYNAKLSYDRLPKDYVLLGGCKGGMRIGVAATPRCRSPEYYNISDSLTVKNDVYDFGVVLLELLAGRRSLDSATPTKERGLVEFTRTSTVARIMDPALEGWYPATAEEEMAMIAYKYLNVKPKKRPQMVVIVQMLKLLLDVLGGCGRQSNSIVGGASTVGGGEEGVGEDEVQTMTVT